MALLFGRVRVDGPSMVPFLASGQRLFVGRLPYILGRPARGDTVVLRHPRRPELVLVKRIAGLPGDSVRVRSGRLEVNGAQVASGVLDDDAGDREWRLGPREYFVAGTSGEDSRSFGPAAAASIVGKAWVSYWPPPRWGLPIRPTPWTGAFGLSRRP